MVLLQHMAASAARTLCNAQNAVVVKAAAGKVPQAASLQVRRVVPVIRVADRGWFFCRFCGMYFTLDESKLSCYHQNGWVYEKTR